MKKQVIIIVLLVLMVITAGCDVKDVQKQVEENLADFGDAPDNTTAGDFPSLLLSNGARHYDITTAWFGEDVDSELESKQVNNDRRDDGLNGTDPIRFTVTNKKWEKETFYVNILIDRNGDGDWENATKDGPDPNEWAVVNMKVEVPIGENREFKTKVSLPDETWMRMTLTTHPLKDWFGEGEFKVGETEDYIFGEETTTTTIKKKKTPPPTSIPPTEVPPTFITTTTMDDWPVTTTLKEPETSCYGNTVYNFLNNPEPDNPVVEVCEADCDEGYTCETESCVCIKDETSTTTTTIPKLDCAPDYNTESECLLGCDPPFVCEGKNTQFVNEVGGANVGEKMCWYCEQASTTTTTTTTSTTTTLSCEEMGIYSSQGACQNSGTCDAPSQCTSDSQAEGCFSCITITCDDIGEYDAQSTCESACPSPSYCQVDELTDCFECVKVTCNPPLKGSSDCNNECGTGESCQQYPSTTCYQCACDYDLYVTSLSSSVSLSASTTCVGESCNTDCALDASVSIQIRNIGESTAPASSATADISPGVGSKSASVESLGPGATSGTKTLTFSKAATVPGSGSAACSELPWWADTYITTATADGANSIVECDEGNNQNSVSASPQ